MCAWLLQSLQIQEYVAVGWKVGVLQMRKWSESSTSRQRLFLRFWRAGIECRLRDNQNSVGIDSRTFADSRFPFSCCKKLTLCPCISVGKVKEPMVCGAKVLSVSDKGVVEVKKWTMALLECVGIWRYLFKYLEKVALMDWKTEFEQFGDQRARPYE